MIQPIGIPQSLLYKGWVIWCWTGWTSEKTIMIESHPWEICTTCYLQLQQGDPIRRTRGHYQVEHWTCHYPDNRPARLTGHWCSVWHGPPDRYLASTAGSRIPPYEYRRGGFLIHGDDTIITECSLESDRLEEQRRALRQLKRFIDRRETRKAGLIARLDREHQLDQISRSRP